MVLREGYCEAAVGHHSSKFLDLPRHVEMETEGTWFSLFLEFCSEKTSHNEKYPIMNKYSNINILLIPQQQQPPSYP